MRFGQEHVAVQLISYEEAELILATAHGDPTLASVLWVGCDGNYRLESILKNAQSADFAKTVYFTTIGDMRNFALTQNLDPTKRIVRADVEGFINEYSRLYGTIPTIYDYASYDALWLAAIIQMRVGIGVVDIPLMRRRLVDLSKDYLGLMGRTTMSDTGDQKYGIFGFASVVSGQNGVSWKYTAGYRFTYAQGNTFLWFDRSVFPGSQSAVFWEIY